MSPPRDDHHGVPFLDWVSTSPRVPGPVREVAGRIAGSRLASRLAHGAFWSLAGMALSRVLVLAASVVTARILGKEGFGQLGVLQSTLLTFQAFASLALGVTATKFIAELRSKDPARAGRILALSHVVSVVTGVIATALVWAFAPWIAARTIGAPELAGPLRITALGLVFTNLVGAQTGALAGFEAFRQTTWLNAISGMLGFPIMIVAVWKWGLTGAVWGGVVTAVLQAAITEVVVRAQALRHGVPYRLEGWREERTVLWTFSLPAVASGIMVTPVNWAAAAILVNQPRGYEEMGAFSAANQWYAAVLFLPTALSGAVLPVLSERVGSGDAAGSRKVLRLAILLNAAVVLPIVLGGSLISPFIMRMYGPGFASAWPTLISILFTAGIVAITNPVGSVLVASERVWLGFVMNCGWAAVFLVATLLMVRWGAFGVATARLIAYVIHAGWTLWFAILYTRGTSAGPQPADTSPAG